MCTLSLHELSTGHYAEPYNPCILTYKATNCSSPTALIFRCRVITGMLMRCIWLTQMFLSLTASSAPSPLRSTEGEPKKSIDQLHRNSAICIKSCDLVCNDEDCAGVCEEFICKHLVFESHTPYCSDVCEDNCDSVDDECFSKCFLLCNFKSGGVVGVGSQGAALFVFMMCVLFLTCYSLSKFLSPRTVR